jgi:4-amino-4-deoxy-L-arabinose transferase-like glycosyltransferase
MQKINSKINFLILLIVSSFILRIATIFFFADTYIENEWGVLVKNLQIYKSYSIYIIDGQVIPSVYMPPVYAYFLYLIKIFTFEKINFLNTVFLVQAILSTYSVYIFYKINKKIFNVKISLINSFIFSFFPLNVYAVGQSSSISLQIFLSLLFLKYFLEFAEKISKKNIIIFSFVSGLLIMTRGEFILIFLTTIFYLLVFKKKNLMSIMKIILIVFLVISPYLIRNYITFNSITITKSSGYNLWKGNNPLSTVYGVEARPPIKFNKNKEWPTLEKKEFKKLKNKLEAINIDKYYEIKRDKIFMNEAINNLYSDPFKYFNLFLKKIFSYYFIDLKSNYPNYYNFSHIIPIVILSVLSFPGIFLAFKKKDFKINYLLIYLFLNLVIFSIFFILPRYKLIILPIQIILAAQFITYIMRRYDSK